MMAAGRCRAGAGSEPGTPIRPRPSRSFADRLFRVAMSPDSVLSAADLGA